MAKRATKKAAAKKPAAKRELIAPRGDKRYIRRDAAAGSKKAMTSAARCPRIAAGRRRRPQSPDRATMATEKPLRKPGAEKDACRRR